MSIAMKDLESLHGRRHNSIMDFMYDVVAAGFEDEFDNSLVLRAFWEKLDALQKATDGAVGEYGIHSEARAGQANEAELVLTLTTPYNTSLKEELVLFVRNDKLTVLTNVLHETLVQNPSDLPVNGRIMYWHEAEVAFEAQKRFDKKVVGAFRNMYRYLTRGVEETDCRIFVSPAPQGWRTEFKIKGTSVLAVEFKFNA